MTAIPIRYDHIPHQEVWVDGSLPIVTADIAVPKCRWATSTGPVTMRRKP